MITDKLCTFFDNEPAAASMAGSPIYTEIYGGRGEPVYISIASKGAGGPMDITATVEESDDGTTFAAAGEAAFKRVDDLPAIFTMRLPLAVKKPIIRLSLACAGSIGGEIWAGVTRDHFAPYDAGLYINEGKVVL